MGIIWGGSGLGCSPSLREGPPEAPVSSALADRPGAAWIFHPTEPEVVRARLALEDGELLVDEGGTRWLVGERGRQPSAFGTPEALVAVGRQGGDFLFLGSGGKVHVARSPLGPFIEERSPPEEWVDAAALGSELIGISVLGHVYRSRDWGTSWKDETWPHFFTSVEVAAERALLVTTPESWYSLEPGASKPRQAGLLPIGVRSLWTEGERLLSSGVLGTFTVGPSGWTPAVTPKRSRSWAVPAHPSAEAVLRGGVLLGDTTVGWAAPAPAEKQARARNAISLVGGEFGQPLSHWSSAPIDCPTPRLARAGEEIVLACVFVSRRSPLRRLVLSRGRVSSKGMSPEPLAQTELRVRVAENELLLALSDRGSVALFGPCPQQAARDEGDCAEDTTVYFLRAGALVPTGISASSAPVALGFFPDSDVVAGVVVRRKDHHVLVHVRDLSTSTPTRIVDLSEHWPAISGEALVVRLVPGQDGLLGVISIGQHRSAVAVLDASGELLMAGDVPQGAVTIHGAGARFLALGSDQRTFFESLDGGLSWTSDRLPRRACRGEDCLAEVACFSGGCLVGAELTRTGWGEATGRAASREVLASSSGTARVGLPEYRCRPALQPWQPLPHLTAFPSASDAALGKTDWSQVEADWASGSVNFVSAEEGQADIARTEALPAVSQPERYALHVSHQIEGAAVVRYEVPADASGHLRNLEVAWDNRIENVLGRGKLAGDIAARSGDFRAADDQLGRAFPGLISVAGKGLYLRPHQVHQDGDVTYYFEENRTEKVMRVAWPGEVVQEREAEFVRVLDRHVPLAFSSSRQEVVIAAEDPPGEFLAVRLLSPHGEDPRLAQGVGFGYLGRSIGVVSKFALVDETQARAYFAPIDARTGIGPGVPVPLKTDLEEAPRSCSPLEKERTPRVLAPELPGPRPTVRFDRGAGESLELLARRAVLFGTPTSPCVAAWEVSASEPASPNDEEVRLLVLPRQAGIGGWAFRASPQRDGLRDVSTVPIECTLH